MKRVKNSFSDVSNRQRRRRIASAIEKELENADESDQGEVTDSSGSVSDITEGFVDSEVQVRPGGSSGSSLQNSAPSADQFAACSDFGASTVGGRYDSSDMSFAELDTSEAESVSSHVGSSQDTNASSVLPSDTSPSLERDLRTWALENNVPASHLNSLLKILSAYHPELPLDARTLLKTQRKTELVSMCGGQYHYFGVTPNLIDHISNHVPEG
ncbi:hypothetical protein V5799_008267, partial [Amblyomma americanum]